MITHERISKLELHDNGPSAFIGDRRPLSITFSRLQEDEGFIRIRWGDEESQSFDLDMAGVAYLQDWLDMEMEADT